MTAILTRQGGSGLLVAESRAADFSADWFEPDFVRSNGLIAGTAGGRGTALFLNAGDEQWVLRHYCRGGLIGRVNRDRYLWLGEDRTRSFHEWRLLDTLRSLDLPVPEPVAARYQRRGVTYSADIITRRLDGAVSWASRLVEAANRSPAIEWQAVGACLRRFHDAGAYHADMNAHNIMLDSNNAVYLLDFDRGAVRKPGSWRQATLSRLQRSLRKINAGCATPFYTDERWACLTAAYSA